MTLMSRSLSIENQRIKEKNVQQKYRLETVNSRAVLATHNYRILPN